MPGPQPMHNSARQRANKTSTRSELEILAPEDRAAIEVPELPAHRMWSPAVSDWWRDIWQSPMRLEWDDSDTAQILAAAVILDEFWIEADRRSEGETPSAYKLSNLSREFRDAVKVIGGNPFARRSLQWMLVQTERDEAQRDLTKAKTATERSGNKGKRRGLDGLQ